MAERGKGPGITWYDVLGVLPGASADQIQHQHDSKARLLRPELIAGAPSPVLGAAARAREILDAAVRVLADPANRARYDEAVGIRRSGGGLTRRAGFPAEPGLDPGDGLIAGMPGAELLGGLLALTDWLAPHPVPPRRVAVPDVRGLFFSVCLQVAGKVGLRVTTVKLTERPMPVDGLVVAQSPGRSVQARRGSVLTVQVWHPPVRLGLPRRVGVAGPRARVAGRPPAAAVSGSAGKARATLTVARARVLRMSGSGLADQAEAGPRTTAPSKASVSAGWHSHKPTVTCSNYSYWAIPLPILGLPAPYTAQLKQQFFESLFLFIRLSVNRSRA